jgi:hypothetical protein
MMMIETEIIPAIRPHELQKGSTQPAPAVQLVVEPHERVNLVSMIHEFGVSGNTLGGGVGRRE